MAKQTLADIASDPAVTNSLSIDSDEHSRGATQSATQRAFQELRRRIINGEIAPGERLKVESLKDLLDTGASPIREALSLLTSDQLVERIDQRGFRAAPASKAQFKELLTLRCQLEEIALRSSINAGDELWEEGLLLSHYRLAKTDRSETEQFELLHRNFHTALLAACESPILLRFCGQLYDLNIRYRFLAGKSLGYSKRDVAREHQLILDATLARDADLAAQHLLGHYSLTGNFLADQFASGH